MVLGRSLHTALKALCCEAGTDVSSCGSEKSEGREAMEWQPFGKFGEWLKGKRREGCWWIALQLWRIELGIFKMYGAVVKNPPLQEMQDSWVWSLVGKIPWSRKWQPTPVLLPGKSYGQRILAGYSPCDLKETDPTEHTCRQTHVHLVLGINVFRMFPCEVLTIISSLLIWKLKLGKVRWVKELAQGWNSDLTEKYAFAVPCRGTYPGWGLWPESHEAFFRMP